MLVHHCTGFLVGKYNKLTKKKSGRALLSNYLLPPYALLVREALLVLDPERYEDPHVIHEWLSASRYLSC